MEASEVLEISKENIQPLKQGRKTSVLGTAIQARTNEDFHHELLKKRDQFEVEIRSYEGDDPLKVWYEYMLWIEQNFPTDGRHGNLHVLLERCLTEFKDVKKYNQDVRFIAMWIKYLNNISNSLEMYKQVHAYGIGTECAIFYKNWAEELEENHDWKRANQVYLEGIQRKAEPVDDLVSAHNNFQLRVARHCLEEQEYVSTPADEMNQRSVLTRLKPHGRKHLVNNVRVGTSIQEVTPGVLRSLDYNGVGNNNKPSGGIKIFTNENADVNDVSLNHVVKPNDPMQYREQIVKENTKKAGRWNEGKFKQKHNPAVNHQPSFEVHEDDQSAIPISQQCTNITINALKQRRFASEENSVPVALFEPPDPTKKPMYPKHKVYTGGTEFSLEELYAIKYKERYSRKLQEQRASQRIDTQELALDSAVPSEGRKMHYYSIDEDKNATKMDAEKAITLDEDKLEQKVLQSSNQKPSIEVFVDKHCENPSNHHTRIVYDDEQSVLVALFEPPDPMKRPMYPKDKVYAGGTEFSLEELYAMKYYENQCNPKKLQVSMDKRSQNPSNNRARIVYDDEKSIPVALFEPPDPMKRPMYPKDKVYAEKGTEFSLEELFVTQYNKRYVKKMQEQERKLKRDADQRMALDVMPMQGNASLDGSYNIDEIHIVQNTTRNNSSKLLKEEVQIYARHTERKTMKEKPPSPLIYHSDNELIDLQERLSEAASHKNFSVLQKASSACRESSTPSLKSRMMDTFHNEHLHIFPFSKLGSARELKLPKQLHRTREHEMPPCNPQLEFSMAEKQTQVPSLNVAQPGLDYCDSVQQTQVPSLNVVQPGLDNSDSVQQHSEPSNITPFSYSNNERDTSSANTDTEINYQNGVNGKSCDTSSQSDHMQLQLFPAIVSLSMEEKQPSKQGQESDHLEACQFFETSGGLNRTEQSFTINTKEAMNAVQGLFTSPQVGRHITDPVIHKSVPVFTIHMDESMAEEKNCHVPDTHQGEIQKKTAPCDVEEEPISRVNVYRQPIQGIRKSNFIQQTQSNFLLPEEHNHQETNFTVYGQDDKLENVFPNAFGQDNETGKYNEPFKMPNIPCVASPGMTKKELLALNDTENKENSTNASVHKGKGINCKDTFRILQPSQHIPFLPWEDLQVAKTEHDDDLGVQPLCPLSDETCTTQVFSGLISSTPFEKHARQSPVEILRNEGGQHMDESYCPRDVTKKIGDKCNSENKSNINTCHYPSMVSLPSYSSGKHLSAIIETSNEKSSGSSGSSGVTSRRLTYHWATQENLKVIEECSLQPDDRCSTGDIRHVEDEVQEIYTYPFPEKFLSELLAKVGFPSTNYKGTYLTLPMRLPCKKKHLNLGNDEYLCSESLVDQRHLDAVEMKSGRKVLLKIQQSICPWEYYIMEEIPLRLKNPDLALYYMTFEKAYSLEKSYITVLEYSPYCDLQTVISNTIFSMTKIPTLIAKYWTYEMLEIMKHLHKCGIIHGDLRLENFLVQDISGTAPSLKLLNFDEAIDMTLFPVETTFSTFDTSQEERYPFLKILHKQHWSYQIDFIKVASSAYTINFCLDLDVIEKDGNWICQERILQHPWKSFFFQLLNVKSSEEFPNVTALQNEIMENVNQELIISELKNFECILTKCPSTF